jgi:hypothetical protein
MNGSGDVEGCDSNSSAMNPLEAKSTNESGAALRRLGQLHCTIDDLTKDNASDRITVRSFNSVDAPLADCSSGSHISSSSVGGRLPYHWEHEKYNRLVSEKNSMRYDVVECCADDSGNDDDIDTEDCSADDDDDIGHGNLVACDQEELVWPKRTLPREAEIVSISNNCDSSSAEAWKQPECDEFYCDLRESIDKIRDRNSRLYDESYEVTDSDDKILGTWDLTGTSCSHNNYLYDESYDVVESTDNEENENIEDNENSCILDLNHKSSVGYSKSSQTPVEHLFSLCSKSMPSSSSYEMKNGSSISYVNQREYQEPLSDRMLQIHSEWSTGPRIVSESSQLSKNVAHFENCDTRSTGPTRMNTTRSSENRYRAEGTSTSLELGAARSHARSSQVVSSDGSTWNHSRRTNFAGISSMHSAYFGEVDLAVVCKWVLVIGCTCN